MATGPTAVRLGNSLNFSESWFHHLYTGLVGINVSLQTEPSLPVLPTPSPSDSISLRVKAKVSTRSTSPAWSVPASISPNLLQVLSPQGWALELPLLKCSSRHRCNSLSGFFQQTMDYIFICSFASLLSWMMKHCLIHGSIPSGYKCLARGGGGRGGG